jgi:uncharacterized protein (DUF2267 family)
MLPMTIADLIKAGGPETFARQAAHKAAQGERRFWLRVLEQVDLEEVNRRDSYEAAVVTAWIKSLRRQINVKPSPEVIRAQTRERVRRFRSRQAAQDAGRAE